MILNRAQIAEKVRLMIGDGAVTTTLASNWRDGSSFALSDAAYGRYVSDAWLTIGKELNWMESEITLSTVASTHSYATDCLSQIYQVDYDDVPLLPINALQLDRMDQKWKTRSGRPQFWLMGHTSQWGYGTTAPLTYSAAASETNREYQVIRLYPNPTAVVDLRLIGLAKPEPLINDFNAPYLPAWLIDAVTYEAAARICESHNELRNPQLSAAYRGLRDVYLNVGRYRRANRQWGRVWIRGESPRTPYTLLRQTHIPVTGLAPGDAE